ncbi:MAG: N-formylglutamate amidohydrolase, partial [Boseongicola sp.]|nr:N-formylglutamate amidohydrolase [Boseongicola sp.]
DFDGHDIWDTPPTAADVEARHASCHAPYHEALQAELDRVRQLHGAAILYDCHSIRSRIPFLFDGTLPDFNIGTNLGATCAPVLQDAVLRICENAPGYSTILNGRFKGGWTTRHYGRPGAGCHAIQMELAQSTYLTDEAPPWTCDTEKAGRLRSRLKSILTTLADMASSLGKDQ